MVLLLEGLLVRMGRHALAAEVQALRQEIIHSVGVSVESGLSEAHVEEHTHQAWSALIHPDSTPFTLGIPALQDGTSPSSSSSASAASSSAWPSTEPCNFCEDWQEHFLTTESRGSLPDI